MTKINFTKLAKSDTATDFANAVADINSRGNTLQLDIQLYLHAVATRFVETGDVRPAVERVNMLVDKKNLFRGIRRNALITWVETMIGFEYIMEGEKAHTFHASKAKAKDINLVELAKKENHWFNFTPEAPYQPLDLNVLIKALVAKAEKRSANAKPEDSIDADKLAALKALVDPEALEAAKDALDVPAAELTA